MIPVNALGVFEAIYGEGAEMTISRAVLISFVGFFTVILILSVLAIFVKAMGMGFDAVNAKRQAKLSTIPEPPANIIPKGTPLPDDTSAGSLKLTDVTEEEAAVIMAITSHTSGIPLNRLQFNSIKPIPENLKGE